VAISSVGATSLEYRTVVGSTWTSVNGNSTSLTFGHDTALQVRAVNAFGTSSIATGNYTFDNNGNVPNIPVLSPDHVNLSNTAVTVNITSLGATTIYYRLNSGSWVAKSGSTTSVALSNNTRLDVYSSNSWGNSLIGTSDYTFVNNGNVPLEPYLDPPVVHEPTAPVVVNINSVGATSLEYTIDGGYNWTSVASDHTTLTFTEDTVLGVRGRNVWGVSVISTGYYYDFFNNGKNPSTPILSPTSADNSNILVTVSISSAGAQSLIYTLNGGVPITVNSDSTSLTLSTDTTVAVYATNIWGNSSTASGTYTFQNNGQVPSTPTLTPASATNSTTDVTVSIASTGSTSIEYSTDYGTTWTTYTTPITLTNDTTLDVKASNVWGEVTTTGTYTFYLTPVSITTTSLSNGTVNLAYSQTLSATGGNSPYTWSIDSGTLPTGLSLDSNTGVISGIPTVIGDQTFTVKATDSRAHIITKIFTITWSSPFCSSS
jgi:hypothetical protein